jgi:DNA gyrase inhibitor GyrI
LDQSIEIEKVPPRKIAVIRFGGRSNESLVRRKNRELISSLKENNILFKGTPFLMRYNSPFMPGPFRRNEVAVELL